MAWVSIFVLISPILAIRGHDSFQLGYQINVETKMSYNLHSASTTLPKAMQICDDEDASLFFPRTQEDLKDVTTIVNQANPGILSIIIGIHDKFSEGLFLSINGEEALQAWAPQEPNNAGGDEDCVALRIRNNMMNDIPCSTRLPFVCERNQSRVLPFNKDCNTHDIGYQLNRDLRKCFRMSSRPKNWFDAFKICHNEGSQLMIVDSAEKANCIECSPTSLEIPSSVRNFTRGLCHVGFHDLFEEGVFRTIKGERLEDAGYANWKPNHPAPVANTLCGAIDHNGELLDVDCSLKALFMCERDANIGPEEALETVTINVY